MVFLRRLTDETLLTDPALADPLRQGHPLRVPSAPLDLKIEPHPRMAPGAFVVELPALLAELAVPAWVAAALAPGAPSPFTIDDGVRAAVRDALRGDGYKPTGRGKPASEYLQRAVAEGALASINYAVDLGNAVSLVSGLPVSVVDLDRLTPPLAIRVAAPGTGFVFNASGQVIDVAGLPCLHDADGPCANAVRDAQRTKTGPGTRALLILVWGPRALGDHVARTVAYARELYERAGALIGPPAPRDG